MKLRKLIITLLVSFMMFGCSPAAVTSDIQATPTELNATSTTPPTQSVMVEPSSTASITPTQIRNEVTLDCIEITSPPKIRSEGVLVLQQGISNRLVFLENKTSNQKYVPADPGMKVWRAYVSPNGKWLIYELDWGEPNGETKFVLTKADGIPQEEIPYYGDWGWSSIYWLNNNVLRVAEVDNAITLIDNFAFNPFTRDKSALISDLPRIANNKNIDWHIDRQAYELGILTGTSLIYDPTLTRVLYPKNGETVSLFNLETDQEIMRYSIPGWGRLPKWSLDGKKLAIVGSMSSTSKIEALDEFLMISRDGPEFKQLTNLTSIYDSVRIEEYSWSPDGTRIAFWLGTENSQSTDNQNPFELAVLDVQAGEIINYCITGISSLKDEIEHVTYDLPIIWSPDGAELLITRHKDDNGKETEVIVVDMINQAAYKAAENMQPIGWMIP